MLIGPQLGLKFCAKEQSKLMKENACTLKNLACLCGLCYVLDLLYSSKLFNDLRELNKWLKRPDEFTDLYPMHFV